MDQTSKNRAYVSLLLTFTLWGSLYVASQIVMRELSTFTVAFLRFVLAWLFLTCLTYLKRGQRKKQAFHPDSTCKKYIWILGFFGYTVAVGMQLMGTKLAGSTTASLINSTNPIVITLLATLILKEPLTKNKVIGILLAVFGVYMIIGSAIQINPVGLLLSIAAVIGWALTSVISRRALSAYPPLQVTRHAIGVAAICNLPICLTELILVGGPETISLPAILCRLLLYRCCLHPLEQQPGGSASQHLFFLLSDPAADFGRFGNCGVPGDHHHIIRGWRFIDCWWYLYQLR